MRGEEGGREGRTVEVWMSGSEREGGRVRRREGE